MEKQGKANLAVSVTDEYHLCLFLLEDPFMEKLLRCHHLILHFLINGELPDETENQRAISLCSKLNLLYGVSCQATPFHSIYPPGGQADCLYRRRLCIQASVYSSLSALQFCPLHTHCIRSDSDFHAGKAAELLKMSLLLLLKQPT